MDKILIPILERFTHLLPYLSPPVFYPWSRYHLIYPYPDLTQRSNEADKKHLIETNRPLVSMWSNL